MLFCCYSAVTAPRQMRCFAVYRGCLPRAKNARFHGYRLGYLATCWLPFATWAGSGAAWVRLQVSHRCRKNFLLLRPCVGVRPQCKRKPGAVAGCWVVPLWSRYPVPADASGASGFVGQSPEAGETTPTVSGQSGIASVIAPPKPTDTGPGGSGALGARRAQRVNCQRGQLPLVPGGQRKNLDAGLQPPVATTPPGFPARRLSRCGRTSRVQP